ncbi:hypothetical protein DFO53_1315 [Enterobacter sp. AG5470]|nr:hypothetical protein DFO53_1315 [Enterobacter sp. AG5470]
MNDDNPPPRRPFTQKRKGPFLFLADEQKKTAR